MITKIQHIIHTMRKNDNGFSFIEIVIAIGIILVLTTGGLLTYKVSKDNARKAMTNAAAEEIFTKAVANKEDDSTSTTPFQATQEYYATKGANHLTILMPKGDNGDPITILVINDAITMRETNYFYYSYESEEKPDDAKAIVDAAIADCIKKGGCDKVERFKEKHDGE